MFEDKTMEIFSSRDAIREQLIKYAQNYLELDNIDMTKSSYLSYLINILSVLTSNLIYYNTATYREFFLVRAHQKESVMNLAAMLGYKPDTAVPATAQVLVTMPTDFKSTAHMVMYGRHDADHEPYKFYASDIVFSNEKEIQVDVIMDRGALLSANIIEINRETGGTRSLNWRLSADKKYLYFTVDVTQVEDQLTEFTFPKLDPYQYYTQTIPFSGDFAGIELETQAMKQEVQQIWNAELSRMENLVVEVAVDDTIYWEDKSSLFLIVPGEYAYTYRVNEKGIKIFFGNGIIGTQPKENDDCKVFVQVTRGYEGNVIAGSITKPSRLNTTVEVNGSLMELPVLLTCINTAPAMGGKSYPSIDEIRSQAVASVVTNKRLVSQFDFENVGLVAKDIPIQHSIPVLKRSDLKRNEICLYTDIIFMNQYVPTRNAVIKIPNGRESYPIRFGDPVEIDLNRFEKPEDYANDVFVAMFDMVIDPTQRVCEYFYTLKDIETETVLKKTWSNDTVIFPNSTIFHVVRDSTDSSLDTLQITFQYEKTSTDPKYDTLKCYLEINELGVYYPMESHDSTNVENGVAIVKRWFYTEKSLSSVPEGECLFDFQVKYVDPDTLNEENVCNCQTTTVIRQSLTAFMYSKVRMYKPDSPETEGGLYWGIVYDFPAIHKDFVDQLIEDNQIDNFTEQVLHRIVTFDMTEYRMITDFVNLKFSNTYGTMTNMNHNSETKGIIHRIDPEILPDCPGEGYTCAVTNDVNVWSGSPWNRIEGGFLARYASYEPGKWIFILLKTNDIVLYDPILPGQPMRPPPAVTDPKEKGLTPRERLPKMIYNGDNLFYLSRPIPLELELEVWKNPSVTISDSGLIEVIKNTIINKFADRMGYDKSIYISDITRVVQDITGVYYCKILKPEHDIFFNYDFLEFKHEDLLRYSPQLVYIVSNLIKISLRKSGAV